MRKLLDEGSMTNEQVKTSGLDPEPSSSAKISFRVRVINCLNFWPVQVAHSRNDLQVIAERFIQKCLMVQLRIVAVQTYLRGTIQHHGRGFLHPTISWGFLTQSTCGIHVPDFRNIWDHFQCRGSNEKIHGPLTSWCNMMYRRWTWLETLQQSSFSTDCWSERRPHYHWGVTRCCKGGGLAENEGQLQRPLVECKDVGAALERNTQSLIVCETYCANVHKIHIL